MHNASRRTLEPPTSLLDLILFLLPEATLSVKDIAVWQLQIRIKKVEHTMIVLCFGPSDQRIDSTFELLLLLDQCSLLEVETLSSFIHYYLINKVVVYLMVCICILTGNPVEPIALTDEPSLQISQRKDTRQLKADFGVTVVARGPIQGCKAFDLVHCLLVG